MADRDDRKEAPIIHQGPMADTRGTSWREGAARLEALDQKRIENPGKTVPAGNQTKAGG